MKKNLLKFIIGLLGLNIANAQTTINAELVNNLDSLVNESSGLIYSKGKLWTHNDSGGKNRIYQINQQNGKIIQTITINGSTNIDWEDMCQNKDYLFIGDFGNNNGNRNNLVIYRIPKSDLLKENASIVTAERINFTYPDQIDYSSKPFNTKFDCEAFVCSGDSLYLFSKDWINLKTRLFSIPSHPGSYTAVLKDSIDAKGLITSATISHDLNKIYLIGYTKGFPSTSFLIKLSDYKKQDFFTGKINRYDFSIPHTTQTEAIATGKDDVFYLSSEKGFKKNAKLFSIVIR